MFWYIVVVVGMLLEFDYYTVFSFNKNYRYLWF